MGSSCDCTKNYNEVEEKFEYGQGIYFFKKLVILYNIIIHNKFFIFLQPKPNTDYEKLFYGKSDNYDEIKNKLDRTNSIFSGGNKEYNNGNVQVFIPCPTSK